MSRPIGHAGEAADQLDALGVQGAKVHVAPAAVAGRERIAEQAGGR